MNGTTTSPPKPTSKSKTLWVALAGILGGLSTAAAMVADTGDWKKALPAVAFAVFSALAGTLRDTIAKSGNAQTDRLETVTQQLGRLNTMVHEQGDVPKPPPAPPTSVIRNNEFTFRESDAWPVQPNEGAWQYRVQGSGVTWRDRDETPAAPAEEEGPL